MISLVLYRMIAARQSRNSPETTSDSVDSWKK
jgi:hypothetical protein